MVFDKLANLITKRYKLILVTWVILLLISVPAIMQVSEVVSYQQDGVSAGDYDSLKAAEIIESEFQTSVANGTLIVLIQSEDVTDARSRQFVLDLQQRILSSSDLKELQGVTSVYSVTEMVMDQTVLGLGPAMRQAETQVGMSAFVLWGVPAMHAANWATYGSDAGAYDATKMQLSSYFASSGASADQAMLVLTYYEAFAQTWNATASDPALMADADARAHHCVEYVAPGFISSLPLNDDEKKMMTAVLGSFDMDSCGSEVAVHQFVLGMVGQAAGISNMTFLQDVYGLGPIYDEAEVDAYVVSVISNGTLATYPVQVPSEYTSGFISSSNGTMMLMLSFGVTAEYVTEDGDKPLLDDVTVLRDIVSGSKSALGITTATYVTGGAALSVDMEASSEDDMMLIEPITMIIIIVLMGVLFRSLVAQFLPLGAVMVALGISQALVFVIGSTVAQIDASVTTMLFSILMGVGTDYSIFIVTRYREERIKGADRERAVHTAVTWAGESIATSGATVVIAFFAMALSSFSMMQTMGLVMGMAILVALGVSLTMIPSLLMLFGNRIFWPTTGERWKKFAAGVMQRKRTGNHGYFHKAATFAVNHSKAIVAVAIVISLPATYVYMTSEPSFDFIGSMGDGESIDGMEAMTEDFGAGYIMPTQIVITGDNFVVENGTFNLAYLDAVENITMVIAANPNVQQVTGITRPYGEVFDYHSLASMPADQSSLAVGSMMDCVGSSGKTVLMTVILKDEPQSSASVATISQLRNDIAEAQTSEPVLASSTILVGGTTASLYDLSTSIQEQFTTIEMIVMLGIFLVLMIVLGSLLLPLFAVVSIAMSIGWSFALTSFVFGTLLGYPILFMVPLILFIMLMGIGMDYNVFILTRIREEVHKGKEYKTAIVDAVDWTGGIITALALIMAGAFGLMMLSSNAMLMEFGFALTVAIILDAMVVRTYIVPAAMTLMGKWAWWAPGRLQRVGRTEKEKRAKKEIFD